MCGRVHCCRGSRYRKRLYIGIGIFLGGCAVFLGVAFGIIRPFSITVEDASLTRFALLSSPTTALAYNLTLTLTVHNPNWLMEIHNKEPLIAAYKFDGQQFDRVQVMDKGKYSPGKNGVYRLSRSSNNSYVTLGDAGIAEYKEQNATGVFVVEVMTGKVRYMAYYKKCQVEATCLLKLQLASPTNPTTATVFEKVKCKHAKREKYC